MDSVLKLDHSVQVRLHQDGRSVTLSPGLNQVEFHESQLLFEIQSSTAARVLFDDKPIPIVWSQEQRSGYGQLDLTNQVGFHRFSIRTATSELSFDFRTSTAKATHDEIAAMARVVAGQVFSFKRQFVYADATGQLHAVPIPEVAFGWLRDRLGEIVKLVRAINDRPATETRQRFISSHQARNVSVPETLRLLRETPGLLEAAPDGPLQADGQRYWPSTVVVRERNREPARLEHTQLAYFLSRVARLTNSLRNVVPQDVLETISQWELLVRSARDTRVVRRHDLPNAYAAWTPLPTQLQKTDSRYRRIRELNTEFLQQIDVSEYSEDAIRVNVRDAWEIYQSFAAHMIGRAFGLKYVSRRGDLRERASEGFSMYSDDFELFYDCQVPPGFMASWREATARPAGERPDIVVRQRSTGAVAVLDAKFRVDRDGASAKGEDLFEMQGYINSFSLRAGAVLFPGNSENPRVIDGKGIRLVEIPLRASFFSSNFDDALGRLRGAVDAVLLGADATA